MATGSNASLTSSKSSSHPPPPLSFRPPIPKSPSSLSASSIIVNVLKCFSARKNAALLLSMPSGDKDPTTAGSGSSIDAIHGLRVLTMGWVIMGHTYGLVNPEVQTYVFSAPDMYGDFKIQGLLNATLAVDTFFFISGLLTIYIIWGRIGSKFRPFGATLVRYMRITPAYAITIGIAILFPMIGYGPLWAETTDAIARPCYEQWWANLLYVNNFVTKNREMCLMHSWFLSNDFQFHIIAMILIWILLKYVLSFLHLLGLVSRFNRIFPLMIHSLTDT